MVVKRLVSTIEGHPRLRTIGHYGQYRARLFETESTLQSAMKQLRNFERSRCGWSRCKPPTLTCIKPTSPHSEQTLHWECDVSVKGENLISTELKVAEGLSLRNITESIPGVCRSRRLLSKLFCPQEDRPKQHRRVDVDIIDEQSTLMGCLTA
jgi:hypothetical protein